MRESAYVVTVEGVVYEGHTAIGTEVHRVRVNARTPDSAADIGRDRVAEPDYRDCVVLHVEAA